MRSYQRLSQPPEEWEEEAAFNTGKWEGCGGKARSTAAKKRGSKLEGPCWEEQGWSRTRKGSQWEPGEWRVMGDGVRFIGRALEYNPPG